MNSSLNDSFFSKLLNRKVDHGGLGHPQLQSGSVANSIVFEEYSVGFKYLIYKYYFLQYEKLQPG